MQLFYSVADHVKIQDVWLKATVRVDNQKESHQNQKLELRNFCKEVNSDLKIFKNIFNEKYRGKRDAKRRAALFVGTLAPQLPMVARDVRRLEKLQGERRSGDSKRTN